MLLLPQQGSSEQQQPAFIHYPLHQQGRSWLSSAPIYCCCWAKSWMSSQIRWLLVSCLYLWLRVFFPQSPLGSSNSCTHCWGLFRCSSGAACSSALPMLEKRELLWRARDTLLAHNRVQLQKFCCVKALWGFERFWRGFNSWWWNRARTLHCTK